MKNVNERNVTGVTRMNVFSKISVFLLGILYSHFVRKGCPGFENFMAEVPSLLNELKPIALFRLLVDFNTITSGKENRNNL